MPENLPSWVAEEVSKAKWEAVDNFSGTGYFLDLNVKEKTADIQFYDPLPDGRHIITVDVSSNVGKGELKVGELYLFQVKIYKASLSDKVKQFLTEHYQINMDAIYRYEMMSVEELKE